MKSATETVTDVIAKRRADYVAAARKAASDGISPKRIDEVCRDADKSPDEFNRLVSRILARRGAVANLAEAARLAGEHAAVMQRLEKHAGEIKAANERLEQLRKAQLGILSEAGILSNRVTSLRSNATATLQKTAASDADWQDVDNVRIDDPAPAAKVLAEGTFSTWRPGNSAVLPSSSFVPSRG